MSDKAYLAALARVDDLKYQRDKLREALIIALETLEDEFGVNSGAANHARSALKSTEEST